MNSTDKSKWQIRAVALLIFLLGFVAGGLAPRAYDALSPSRPNRFEQVLDRLRLTPEQRPEVERILGDSRARVVAARRAAEPQLAEIRRETDERLRQVLTAEQWERFRQMQSEMRGRRRRRR